LVDNARAPRHLSINAPRQGRPIMPTIDFHHLSAEQRLDRVGELCDSLDPGRIPVTPAQRVELDRRLETLDEDMMRARSAQSVLADLRRRCR
jgi:putative addiction module component (TIGR02574 family)